MSDKLREGIADIGAEIYREGFTAGWHAATGEDNAPEREINEGVDGSLELARLSRALAAVGEQGPQPGREPESLVWHSVDQPIPADGYILVGPTCAEGVPEVWAAETFHQVKAGYGGPGWYHLHDAFALVRFWAHLPPFPTNVSSLAAVGSPNPPAEAS